MVEFEVEGQQVAKCKKPREHDRRCYAVRVCIEKNPARKKCGRKCDVENPYAPCPAPPTLPPLRYNNNNNPVVCCNCQPVVSPCPKKRSNCKKKERECQTERCCPQMKERDTQCCLIPEAAPPPPPPTKCCTQDSPCQTIRKEIKHCGHQISPICCEKHTKHCQTELDTGCNAVGVAHDDRQVCGKPCCKKAAAKCNVKKQDACCNTCPPNYSTQGTCNKSRPNSKKGKNRGNCNRPKPPPPPPVPAGACERKYEFPFVGRTSSGNIKVRPSMISYENKEFGILVANPKSIRTSVKRISSCDRIFPENCPPSFPAPHPPTTFMCKQDTCSLETPEKSCKTACPALQPPPPRFHDHECPKFPRCPHHEMGNLEMVEPKLCHPEPLVGRCAERKQRTPEPFTLMKCEFERTQVSCNNMGQADGWNYVNLMYQEEGGGRGRKQEGECQVCKSNTGSRGRDTAHMSHKTLQTESRNGKGRLMEASQNKERGRGPPPMGTHGSRSPFRQEGFMETGMDVETEEEAEGYVTEVINTYDYNPYQYRGTPNNSELPGARRGRSKPLTRSDGRRPPSAPAFPQEAPQYPSSYTSGSDGYHTTTEMNLDDQKRSNKVADSSRPSRKQQPHTPSITNATRPQNENDEEEDEFKMVGKLHYILKGKVDPNAKVAVGNAVFPVHSVVLEIRTMPPGRGSRKEEVENVKLPDLNSRPINYEGENELTPNHSDETFSNITAGRSTSRKVHRLQTNYSMQDRAGDDASGVISSLAFLSPYHNTIDQQSNYNLPNQNDDPYHPSARTLTPWPSCEASKTPSQKNMTQPRNRSDVGLDPDYSHYDEEETGSLDPSGIPVREQETVMRLHEHSESTLPIFPTESSAVNTVAERPSEERPTPKPRKSSLEDEKEDPNVPTTGLLPNLDVITHAILAFGGINPKLPCTKGNTGKEVYMYTKDADKWRKVGVLPHPRTHYGLACVNSDVYLIGGTDPENVDNHGKSIAVNTNMRVNLRSGIWESLPDLDKPRSHFGCAVIGDNIYVIGGNIDSRATSSCLMFNVENQTWTKIASLDSTRSNMGIVVVGRGILVAGGTSRDAKKPVLETVMHYDPLLDRWIAWKSLPSPRAFCSLAVVETKIYLIAGAGLRDVQKRKNSSLPSILVFHPVTEDWYEAGALKYPRHGHATAVIDKSIVVIAGVSSQFQGPIHSVEIWSPSKPVHSRKAKSFRHSQSGMSVITL